MYLYSLGAWFILVILAIINGIIRTSCYSGKIGELAAHQLSTVIFCIVILLFSYVFFRYSGVRGESRDYVYVGVMWLVLTVALSFFLVIMLQLTAGNIFLQITTCLKEGYMASCSGCNRFCPSIAHWLVERRS
ncbi:MAG: hypothetical protein R2741_14885 [Methanolobus sp.]